MDYDYININKVAQAKGLSSNRAIRLEINKPDSKYIYREVNVKGGTSYEILFSSLEPEVQEILAREDNYKNCIQNIISFSCVNIRTTNKT